MRGILLTGVLYPSEERWMWLFPRLREIWGEPQRESPPFLFDCTTYYRSIGDPLYRRFLSFPGLRSGDELAAWKQQALSLERESGPQRSVNIDPGILDGARLILASTKDRAQRIPVGQGLFAEITLMYRRGKWISFEYTFPDFRDERYHGFLSAVRNDWADAMRKGGTSHD
jgi:hypothetical protein